MTADIFLALAWVDSRLNFNDTDTNETDNYVQFTGDACDHFWQPDLYFFNARSGQRHTLTQSNKAIFVTSSGNVQLGQRCCELISSLSGLELYGC